MLLCRSTFNFLSVLTIFSVTVSILVIYQTLMIIHLIGKRLKLKEKRRILKNSILAGVGCEFRHYLLIFVFKTTKCSPDEVHKGSFGVCTTKSDRRFLSSWSDLGDVRRLKSDMNSFLNDLEFYFGLQPSLESAYHGFSAEDRDTFVTNERKQKADKLGNFVDGSKCDLSSYTELTETPARMQPLSRKSQAISMATDNLSKNQVLTMKKQSKV